jgi:ubiquitin-conjugating enzyme E2 D/E
MSNVRRLKKEFEEIKKNDNYYISAGPVGENIYEWEGFILGPKDTPYEGGLFKIEIHIPLQYPFQSPNFIFATKIYHPNINSSGQICMDILKQQWNPSLSISKVLLSICSLLSNPNPDDPLVPDIAYEYIHNNENYKRVAREWTIMNAPI